MARIRVKFKTLKQIYSENGVGYWNERLVDEYGISSLTKMSNEELERTLNALEQSDLIERGPYLVDKMIHRMGTIGYLTDEDNEVDDEYMYDAESYAWDRSWYKEIKEIQSKLIRQITNEV